ncbi:MAG: aromatic ring-hydroxylating dioxygenase subunit alpha [Gammaproteobacteria bacterium]
MFLRNCWYVAAWDYEIASEGLMTRTILGDPVLIYRLASGALTAIADRCCHRQAPLSRGRREGDDIRCMYHGLKFDPTGRCIEIPGQESIPPAARVRSYPIEQRHSWIWVWMGDPEKADTALIPPAAGLDAPEWLMKSGHMDYQANYELINDNLCDFSHLAYVHEKTFGAGDDQFATTRPKISTLPRGIRVERWTVNPPSQEYDRRRPPSADMYLRYDYLAPGILLMYSAQLPAGSAQRADFGEPRDEPHHANFTSQAVTPTSETASRYFFCWGPRSSEALATPQLVDDMFSLAGRAFEEDRKMIEAQQRNLLLSLDDPPLFISHDRGPSLMRQVLRKLIEEERGSRTPSPATA